MYVYTYNAELFAILERFPVGVEACGYKQIVGLILTIAQTLLDKINWYKNLWFVKIKPSICPKYMFKRAWNTSGLTQTSDLESLYRSG